MAFSVLNSLALAFMVAGLTLLITAVALSHRARRYQLGMQALLQLSTSHLDLLDLPPAAWPALQAAGWRTLRWDGDWFGQPVHGSLGESLDLAGAAAEAVQRFDVTGSADAHLRVQLRHGMPRGEKRLFANHLAQVFVLLLETRLRERTAALSAALAERARLSLYLQHDMRNLAQWVTWVGTDFVHANSPETLMVLARRLQGNAPLVLERAQRLMAALARDSRASVPRAVALRSALEQAARLAGIEVSIDGDANVWVIPELLERALDNLLSNLATDWREGTTQSPSAVIRTPGKQEPGANASVELLCQLPARGLDLPPERLFEPFASGRPGGLGLGLYQARHSLREAGGDLCAAVAGRQLRFTLLLPAEGEAPDKTAVAMTTL